jgi:gliding motility-associated-like protein
MKSILKLLVFFFTFFGFSQQPTDCVDSIIICGNSNLNLDVNGIGTQELTGSNNCSSQENNSIWLSVTTVTNGTLGFTLTPNSNNIVEDYDFFIFGPNVPCNNLGQAIRCSTTNPQAANQGNNLTGMNGTETDTSEGPGADGNSFVRWLDVLAGETYYIVIDRPIGNSPFSLEWTGTAQFSDPPVNPIDLNPNLNLDLENCDVTAPFDDGFTEFNLENNTNTIIGSQTDVNVTYHISESDATINENPLTSPFTNTSNGQTIYFRIADTTTGCYEIGSFALNVNLGPDYNQPTEYIDCDNDNDGDNTNGQIIFDLQEKTDEILNGLNNSNLNIKYYNSSSDAQNDISPLPILYYNNTPFSQEIFVRIEDALSTNCFNVTSFNLTVNPLPNTTNSTLTQCDEDGLTDGYTLFNLTEAIDDITGGNTNVSTLFYTSQHDAENDENEIDPNAFSNWFNPQILYVQVIDDTTGCSSIAELTLEVSITNANDAAMETCDDDGTEDGLHTFDLTEAETDILNGLPADLDVSYYETYQDALLETNAISTNYTNTEPYSQVVYVRVENMNACYGINQIQLTVYELPDLIVQDNVIYCLNSYPETITINGGVVNDSPNNYYYLWNTGDDASEIEINQPGTYHVTVSTVYGCAKDRTVVVEASNIATIEDIEVVDAANNNIVTVLVSGEGDYEYALDDINGPYQDENVFDGVSIGFHNVYVRDKNECGISEELVSVIGFPKFFTPNNDGQNDTWQVKGVNEQFQPNTIIYIFNRHGKLLEQIDPLGPGWNGNYNGNPLPGDDYWFKITLQDGRTYTDHFTLKR